MLEGSRKERTRKTNRRRGVVRTAPPLQIRLTDEERAELEAKANAAGMTMTDFVREHIGKTTIVNRKDWQRLVYLTSNIANNLNQLAKWCNTYTSNIDAIRVVIKLAEIEKMVHQIVRIDNDEATT